MQFNYKARKISGEIFQGVVEAPSEEVAADVLMDRGLSVITLESAETDMISAKREIKMPFGNGVKKKDVVIFARQLSVMTSANVPIVQALKIITQQTEKPGLQKIVADVADEVESGVKLSSAMGKYLKVFSNFFVSMIKSGETSGKLDEVLEYLADQEEKDYDLVSKIKGAMIYPIFIMSGLVIVGIAMMIFVIPQLTSMLTASGSELPLSTKLLIGTSDLMRNYWWALLIAVIGIGVGVKYGISTPVGKKFIDNLKIKLPVFGNLFKKIYLVRFTQSLATLVVGGVALTDALKIVSEVVGNQAYKDLIDQTIKEVEDGNSVAVVFLQSDIMPKMVSNMLAIG